MSERDRDLERGPQGDHGQAGEPGRVGPAGPQGEQGKSAKGLWPTLRLLAFLLVTAAAIFSTSRTFELAERNRHAIERINVERAERIDQSCRGDEEEHLNEITRLTRTYEYVDSLPRKPFNELDTINQAVIRQIPDTEAEAKTDSAPAFCDETLRGPKGQPVHIGLPEPDPIVPKRPESVDRLLQEASVQQDKREDAKFAATGDVRGK